MLFICYAVGKKNEEEEYTVEATCVIQNLKYSLFDPLQEKFANPWAKLPESKSWSNPESIAAPVV